MLHAQETVVSREPERVGNDQHLWQQLQYYDKHLPLLSGLEGGAKQSRISETSDVYQERFHYNISGLH